MARMHSRAKGKSGSSKPLTANKPAWLTRTDKEVELLVSKLAKEGHGAAYIGTVLRDSYAVPSVKLVTGKTISQIIQEKGLAGQFPDDMMDLLKRSVKIRKHLSENKKDKTAVRGLQLTESKILRLSKYYKANGRLEQTWKYNPEEISLLATE